MKRFTSQLSSAPTIYFLVSLIFAISAGAQTYETSLTTTTLTENFDELGISASATLPNGWVFAQGSIGLPTYGSPLNCETPPIRYTNAPVNCQSITRDYDGANSGGSGLAPTGGGRVNWSDSSGLDRSIGLMSVHSTANPPNTDFWAPTNYIMFGFYNNTGSNIVSLAVTNNIKQYRVNATAATVAFFYSYDGTNWTHLSTGDVGPFPTGASTYLWSSPNVSNVSFTISGLSISNGAPFYLSWQFIIATYNGSSSAGLGLDDVGLTATLGAPAIVGNSTWTAAGGNWNTAANWKGNTLPTSGNSLFFAGAGGATTNNLTAVTTGTGTVGAVTLSNTAGAYSLNGNGITLGSGLTNNSGATQTINLPLTLLTDQSLVAASGNLVVASVITNGGYALSFGGASNVTLNGSATGNGSLNMSGTGTLFFNGSNTYGGETIISSGTVQLGGSEKIPDSSALTVSAAGTFNLTNYSETVASLGGGGNVNLGSGYLTLAGGGAASFGGIISGTGGIYKTGAGTETISATNFYHGTTLLTSGLLAIANVATLGDGPLVLAGGTFQLTGTRDLTNGILPNALVLSSNTIIQNTTSATAGNRYLPFDGPVIATNGTLTIQNIATGNYTNIMHLRLLGTVTNFTQPIVFDNSLALSQVNNTAAVDAANTNGSPVQIFSGLISGAGKFYRASLTPGLGGSAILTAQNTFTFGTYVSGGFLGLGADSTSSGGEVVSGPVGTGTLEFDDSTVGGLAGVGLFAAGGPHVIANRVLLNGVTNTAFIGTNYLELAGPFDVGGIPKTLTVSNTALTTISGSITNTANLTIAGPGVLALTADNSAGWSGTLNLTGGTLLANNPSGSASGTNFVTVSGGTLAGTGSLLGAVVGTTGGNIAPGNPVGILTLQNGLDLSGGGALVWTLGANSTNNPGTDFSQLAVSGGMLNLGGSSILALAFTNAATIPAAPNVFWLTNHAWRVVTLSGAATLSGNFTAVSNGSFAAGTFTTTTDASGVLLKFTPGTTTASPSKIAKVSLTGNILSLYLTNGTASSAFQIVTATNLTQSLGTWTVASSGSFAGDGTVTNSLTINPAEPERFYRVKQ